jgi:hypothetical protein
MLRQYGTDLWQLNHYNYLNVAGWDRDNRKKISILNKEFPGNGAFPIILLYL